ncbi:hypothetical protein C8Q77DRAFT_1062481 [Trametes polyzona]|nr:hypothetical protein C8Q77DRAFT_1062481 [Trametes polyzona]
MVTQLSVPGQSSGPSRERLGPFGYVHSNTTKSSDISIGVQSTSTTALGRGRSHLDSAYRPEARPTARATARGISRVAARVPSRTPSRATSRSRSRAPSRSPLRSRIDLPNTTHPSTGSPNTLALPVLDTVPPSPDDFPPLPPSLNETTIWPILVVPRYDDCPTVNKERVDWQLPPVTLSYSLEGVPPEWTPCTHPEGRLYFYHTQKRIFTDADVRQPMLRAILATLEGRLNQFVQDQGIVLPIDYELVLYLEARPVTGGYNWLYYYVDHHAQALFWVHEWNILNELPVDRGVDSPSDIKYAVEMYYWYAQHREMYPFGHSVAEDDWTELSGILVFASIDVMTSLTSTVTYSPDDAHRMLGLVKSAKAVKETDYATVVVARLMNLFFHQRFLNRHGQTYARISREQSVYNPTKHPRTALITLLSPLFWNAPEVHLRGLEKIWVDGIITIQPWSGFIGRLLNEWQEFILYSTVLLNANVAFLAIPSVDDGTGHLSAAQISSNLSIVTSVGSILLGLILVRQHRVKSKDTAQEALWYLNSRTHPTLGLETLAIIYSLPYALLMWAMVTFLLAFSLECFETPDKVGIFTTAGVWIAIGVLVFWCIFTGWESSETALKDRVRAWLSRMLPVQNKAASEQEASDGTTAGTEKSTQRWLTRLLKRAHFPHRSDPPATEMSQRTSSSV